VDDVRAVLFGLDGFAVIDAAETDEGLVVMVETVDPVLGCPSCGSPAGQSKDRPKVKLRDVCSAGRRVKVIWVKHRRKCPDDDCERETFTEQNPQVGFRRRTTRRCREHLGIQIGAEARPVSRVAAEVGVSWPTGMKCVREHAESVLDDQAVVRRLGVDETAFRKHQRWVTNIADLDAGREVDVIEGRSAVLLGGWLASRPLWWRNAVEVVAMDASAPFRKAVREWLPNATVVLDAFHALGLFHQAIDEIRRRTAWAIHQRRGRKVDDVWKARHLLLKGHERLTDRQRARLFKALAGSEDPDGEIGYAYLVKETARAVWANPSIGAWGELLELLADSDIPELERIGGTLDRWHGPIIASFRLGVSNAATEGLNRKVKHVKRVACGFRNRDNYRTRVLLHTTGRELMAP